MLDGQAASTPDLPFLIAPERQWTYREALGDIDATAVLLSERYGVAAGDRVAIVAANHAEYAILMWATLTLGAIVTSLNGWWTGPELAHGIGLTTPRLIAGDERRLARLDGGMVPDGVPVRLLDALLAEAQGLAGKVPERAGITEDSPAVILFTSGTTGRSKGATLSHRNIINFAMVNRLAAASGAMATASAPVTGPSGSPRRAATIVSSPMFHISGLVAVLITGAAFPVSLVFPTPGPWDPLTWLELTQRHKVTSLSGVPTQFWRLLRHPRLDAYDISSVTTVGGGGAVCPPELVRELHARFPSVRLGNGYGMSETVGLGTLAGGEAFVAIPESVRARAGDGRGADPRRGRVDSAAGGRGRGDLPAHPVGVPRLLGRPGGDRGGAGRRPLVPERRLRPRQRRPALPGKPPPRHDLARRGEHLPRRDREPPRRAPRH